MTLKETSAVMDIIFTAYPKTFVVDDAKKTIELWASMFEDESVEDVLVAIKTHIATDTKGFPPTIGAIKNTIIKFKTADVLSESEAWRLVREAISNGYYHPSKYFDAFPPLVQQIVGSPEQIREWAMLDDGIDTVVASNFMRNYRAKVEEQRYMLSLPSSIRSKFKALAGSIGERKMLSNGTDQV